VPDLTRRLLLLQVPHDLGGVEAAVPTRVRIAEIFPDWAQRVTVFGLTRKISATSLGVRRAVVSIGSCMEVGSFLIGGLPRLSSSTFAAFVS